MFKIFVKLVCSVREKGNKIVMRLIKGSGTPNIGETNGRKIK